MFVWNGLSLVPVPGWCQVIIWAKWMLIDFYVNLTAAARDTKMVPTNLVKVTVLSMKIRYPISSTGNGEMELFSGDYSRNCLPCLLLVVLPGKHWLFWPGCRAEWTGWVPPCSCLLASMSASVRHTTIGFGLIDWPLGDLNWISDTSFSS